MSSGQLETQARATSFPPFRPTSGELIRRCARRRGDAPFVVLGDERLTYAEAESRSAALAKGLLAAGVGKSTHVGLLAPNGPDWVVAWLAVTRIGALAALLNTYGRARELGRVLRHGDAGHLLTVGAHLGHDYLARLEEAAPGLPGQRHERLLLPSHPYLRAVWAWGARPGAGGPARTWCGAVDDLVSRGAAVPDEVLAAAEDEVHPADPMVYTPMPLFWVGGLSFSLVAAMHAGASLVFEERFEPGATLALLGRERVTQVLGWPHMGKALTDHPTYRERDLSALRSGAATALPAPAHREPPGPRATSLGMTETLGPHTFEEDVPLPAADTFTPDGWYRTGDTGRFDEDGHLFFTGRLTDVVKTSGMNVTPREVEEALEGQPGVALAIVTGIDHPDRGQDVAAAVALSPGASLEPDAVRRRLRDELAAYKVPRHVAVFARQADLPLLDSGKVDRRRLAQLLAERFGPGAGTGEGT